MRRKMIKALSLVLGGLVSTAVRAQDPSPEATEYGIPMPEVGLEPPMAEPEYGIQEPVFLEPPPPPPVLIQGAVVRKADGVPIPGVKVRLGDREALTSADGRFSFALPGPGEPGDELELSAEDVDGAEGGGRFKTGATEITLTDGGQAPAGDAVIELIRK